MKATDTFDAAAARAELLALAGDLEALALRARTLRLTLERTNEHKAALRRLRRDEVLEPIASWGAALKTEIEEVCVYGAAALRDEARLGDGVARSA